MVSGMKTYHIRFFNPSFLPNVQTDSVKAESAQKAFDTWKAQVNPNCICRMHDIGYLAKTGHLVAELIPSGWHDFAKAHTP